MEGKPVCSKCLKTHWVGEACKPVDAPVVEPAPQFDRSAAMKASWARRKSGAQDPSP